MHVVVFPELSLTGYELDIAAKLAGDLDDNVWQVLQQEAELTHLSLVVGAPMHAQRNELRDLPTPKPVIASIVLRPLLPPTIYTKMHLHHGESHFIDAGTQYQLWQVQQHNLALAICADSTHPFMRQPADNMRLQCTWHRGSSATQVMPKMQRCCNTMQGICTWMLGWLILWDIQVVGTVLGNRHFGVKQVSSLPKRPATPAVSCC